MVSIDTKVGPPGIRESSSPSASMNEPEADVRTVAQYPAELDVEERQGLEVASVLQRPAVDRIEPDRPGQSQHGTARVVVVAGDERSQHLTVDLPRAQVLSECRVEGLDDVRAWERLLQLLATARGEANGQLEVGC